MRSHEEVPRLEASISRRGEELRDIWDGRWTAHLGIAVRLNRMRSARGIDANWNVYIQYLSCVALEVWTLDSRKNWRLHL